jgi:hypothetical protein
MAVTVRGSPQRCEMSRLTHFLDSRLRDGGQVVRIKGRLTALYSLEESWYSFLLQPKPRAPTENYSYLLPEYEAVWAGLTASVV